MHFGKIHFGSKKLGDGGDLLGVGNLLGDGGDLLGNVLTNGLTFKSITNLPTNGLTCIGARDTCCVSKNTWLPPSQ